MIQVWNNEIGSNEIANFENSVANKYIMEGPILQEFESRIKDLLGVKHVIGTASGSASLALSLLGIGILPGDEVLVPDITFIATANAAKLVGAKVIAVPIEDNRPILDINRVDDYITEKTKAIITVDLNGRISWSKELRERYSDKGIFIIDDACQAFMSGTQSERAGTQADIGCFSFGITKTVSTINGGAVVTNDDELYERMKIIKTQGMKSVFDGDTYFYPGFNFKLPDVLASIGIAQLDRLTDKVSNMKQIERKYRSAIEGINGVYPTEESANSFHWMVDVYCDDRERVRKLLKDNDIISRPASAPLHTAHYIDSYGDYSNSDNYSSHTLFLPCGPDQPVSNVERVIDVLRKGL